MRDWLQTVVIAVPESTMDIRGLAVLILIAAGQFVETHQGLAQQIPATPAGKKPATTDSAPKNPPRITPSLSTTKILGPLDDDGYVDYVAALNEIYSRNVTPENNAGLLFVRASGIAGLAAAERKRFFELLHCEPLPGQGDYLADLDEFMRKRLGRSSNKQEQLDRDRAMRTPWSARKFPLIAQWIEFNERPLQLIFEGTRRPKCYFPFVLPKGECLLEMPLSAVQASRTAARLLTARAMLALGDGQIDRAESDLLACHRLGRLIGATPFIIGALVGVAIDTCAWDGDIALMSDSRLSAKSALAYQREPRGLPPFPRLDETLDKSERFSYLQMLGLLARPKGMNGKRSAVFEKMPPFVSETTLLDWREVLEVGNEQFDNAVAILREPSIPRRQAAWDQFQREFTALHEAVKRHDFNQLPLQEKLSRKALSREFGKIMITAFFPAASTLSEAAGRVQARTALEQAGFALAAYRADHDSYPNALVELAPHYIQKVPLDPFIEGPLHYGHRPESFLLYSVGSNGNDDGGAALGEKQSSDDIVIKVDRSATTVGSNDRTTATDELSPHEYETVTGLMAAAGMLFIIAIYFGLAATAVRLLVTRRLSTALAAVHIALAGAALLLLIYAATLRGFPFLGLVSLGLFAVAAFTGARMFVVFHLKKKSLSAWLLWAHGIVAIAALALLWTEAFRFDEMYRHLRITPLQKGQASEVGKYEGSRPYKLKSVLIVSNHPFFKTFYRFPKNVSRRFLNRSGPPRGLTPSRSGASKPRFSIRIPVQFPTSMAPLTAQLLRAFEVASDLPPGSFLSPSDVKRLFRS